MGPDRALGDIAVKSAARIGGREIELTSANEADFLEVQPGVFSILHEGRSYEAQVVPDGDGLLVGRSERRSEGVKASFIFSIKHCTQYAESDKTRPAPISVTTPFR